MLINYEFSNFRSVGKKPVKISFEAAKDKTLTGNLIKNENLPDTLKGIFVYGNNGSGKTSVISSFGRLQDIILYSFRERESKQSHALYRDEKATYKLAYTVEGIRYDYYLSYIGSQIKEESLYFSPNGRTTKIFERNEENFSFGPQFDKDIDNCNGLFRPTRPLLSVAFRVTKIEPIQKAYSFFRSIITFLDKKAPAEIEERVGEYLKDEHPENKEKILFILKKGGFDIEDIIVDSYEEPIPRIRNYEEKRESDFFGETPEERTRTRYEVSVKHPQFILPLTNESNGTLHMFRMAIALCRIVEKDMILLCDEPETSMHPNLVKTMIEFFMSDSNKKAQIFCATHATELMDLSLLRRDQFYLAKMSQKDRSTQVERLSDINGIRTTEKVEQNFLKGNYN